MGEPRKRGTPKERERAAKDAVNGAVSEALNETDRERAARGAGRLRELLKAKAQGEVRLAIGVRDGHVALTVGEYTLPLTADQADELSADLRNYSLELRNGGRLL